MIGMDRVTLVALESIKTLQAMIAPDDIFLSTARKSIDAVIPELVQLLEICQKEQHSSWERARVMQGIKLPCKCPKCDTENAAAWLFAVQEAIRDESIEGISESKEQEVCASCSG